MFVNLSPLLVRSVYIGDVYWFVRIGHQPGITMVTFLESLSSHTCLASVSWHPSMTWSSWHPSPKDFLRHPPTSWPWVDQPGPQTAFVWHPEHWSHLSFYQKTPKLWLFTLLDHIFLSDQTSLDISIFSRLAILRLVARGLKQKITCLQETYDYVWKCLLDL